MQKGQTHTQEQHSVARHLRAFQVTRINQQALEKVPDTIDGQNCMLVKDQWPKPAWSTVKLLKRTGEYFDPWSLL